VHKKEKKKKANPVLQGWGEVTAKKNNPQGDEEDISVLGTQ